MAVVHWLGAGLSAVPGIRRLADAGQELVLWNRTLSKAQQALEGIDSSAVAKELDWSLLKDSIKSGDVLVSMLPATMHMQVAEICLEHDAHFVSSSYVSSDMESLSERAKSKSLCFVNEVGLDPGLDHLMAHVLVHGAPEGLDGLADRLEGRLPLGAEAAEHAGRALDLGVVVDDLIQAHDALLRVGPCIAHGSG